MVPDRVKGSPSLEMVNLVLEKKAKGERVISLAIGDPSFDTPREIVDVATKSMLEGDVHYVHSYGTMGVREAIKRKVERKNAIHADIENTLFMTTKMAVYVALSALSRTSFEVLVPDPGYFYSEAVTLAGGEPVRYILAKDFSLDLTQIKRAFTKKTKAIIINSPSNPTGKVLTKSELKELYSLCQDRGIYILSDEAYEDLTFQNPHFAAGALEDSPERVVSLFSLSKSYSMTGWRAGYVVAPKEVIESMNKFVENALTCFPPFIMRASAYALDHGDRYIEEFRREYIARKRLLEEKISEIKKFEAATIEGSFYAFPKCGWKGGSRDLCRKILAEKNVALLPGSAFGPSGEDHVRISFSVSPETIRTGMENVRQFFAG
jgi:aspartate aminotransferase